jgi:membrane protein implicated in regulation of membrane protease activity
MRNQLLNIAECAIQAGFGFLLGLTDVAVAYTTPAGTWRTVVWVLVLIMSVVAIVAMNRAASVARGRRPRRHGRNPSTDSQTHNLSIRALIRGFRRG